MTLESAFVKDTLKPELERRLPGCVILKLDPIINFQGIPDHLVLWGNMWAVLESKRARAAQRQANQEYYVDKFDKMSFGAFIHPGNYLEVLDELERAFKR